MTDFQSFQRLFSFRNAPDADVWVHAIKTPQTPQLFQYTKQALFLAKLLTWLGRQYLLGVCYNWFVHGLAQFRIIASST